MSVFGPPRLPVKSTQVACAGHEGTFSIEGKAVGIALLIHELI
jgi:hypothetical protein